MSLEKVVVDAMEKAVTACLLSDGIKAVLEERIREYKERTADTIGKDSSSSHTEGHYEIINGYKAFVDKNGIVVL